MIKAAVLGYGTVGSGVVEVLHKNKDIIAKRVGQEIEVKYILDLRDFPGDPFEDKVVHDVNVILEDPEISIVCETMGGTKPAYQFTKDALLKGKSVCTSNKELVASYGPELLQIAAQNNCSYLFEASVGGGIPIIRPMNTCLAPENIVKIKGILNGTTNYILHQMIENGKTFEEALKEAQDNGFAEKNPAADVEGHDACRKIAILASLAGGQFVDYKDIPTEGITNITAEDVKYAGKLGYSIKLIGYLKDMDEIKPGKIYSIVAPMFVKKDCPLSDVNGVFNAIMITGDSVGDVMFYGRGAGKLPTASAIVADIIDSVKHVARSKKIQWVMPETDIMYPVEEAEFKYFVRVRDNGAISEFEPETEISDVVPGEVGIITKTMKESEIEALKQKLGDKISVLRILD